MIKRLLISSAFLFGIIIIQSTLFRYIAIYEVIPNLYLIYLVFTSFYNGGLHGTVCGFATGLVEDAVSISPLGFHSIIKTIIGSVYSSFNGLVILDRIVMPMAFVLIATVLNRLLAFGVISLFNLSVPVHSVFSRFFLIEIVYNTILTPPVFFIAHKIKDRLDGRRGL
ncbi:rod shape-determining protein MreD [Spirochaeta isovalerica]|uniref:Rod shape-determining protein MreD n=1 Tax=Spirochaeta isovalerica TaxID=150 RepID=A0A841R7Z3_9SPIO|nr:rod shape-determining protein MreD [Spirochaeta isovalerica]MBB6479089.1 rod shape-determining protein MreD [Spirochaeta isovalerica]